MSDAAKIVRVSSAGRLEVAGRSFRCALGAAGIVTSKIEGDGGTPAGRFPLRSVYYRADKLSRPLSYLPVIPIKPDDGWCDDPESPAYNRLIQRPFAARHETLWRGDSLYDVVVEIGYNDDPPVSGKGSAIFMHVAREGYKPTEGCIALGVTDLLRVVARVGPDSILRIDPRTAP